MPATRETATARHWTCGRRLRERRHALGLTQSEVVTRLDGSAELTNRSISSWENGRGLDFGWLPELAAALDCTITYLLGLTDDPHRWQPDAGESAVTTPPAMPPATDVSTAAAPPEDDAPTAPTSSAPTGEHRNWILGPGPLPLDRVNASDRP
jgi:transcriptional regulator with XRE-family HTH domain